jgi:hypothetical protein
MIKEKTSGRFGTRKASVGLAKIGTITFNPAAYELMGKPERIRLWFDMDDILGRRIWIEPTDDPNALEVKVNRSGLQYRINSRKLVRGWDIPPSSGKPYELVQTGNYFFVDVG